MSQNIDLGPTSYFMSKNFLLLFATQFSRFHKMKTKP